MTSAKLPPFGGRCRAADLVATAARRAAQAQYLRRWHQLSPETEAAARRGAEAAFGRMLAAMAAVLATALGLAWGLTQSFRF